MLTGQFLRRLCGSDVSLQLRVDRVLSGPYSHPVSLAALENRRLRKGGLDLCKIFFDYVGERLMDCEPGTLEWLAVVTEERAFFQLIMARCRTMRLPVGKIETVGLVFFDVMAELKSIRDQVEKAIERIKFETVAEFFGSGEPSDN